MPPKTTSVLNELSIKDGILLKFQLLSAHSLPVSGVMNTHDYAVKLVDDLNNVGLNTKANFNRFNQSFNMGMGMMNMGNTMMTQS